MDPATPEGFKALQTKLREPIAPELTGYAAEDALKTLEENWRVALKEGSSFSIVVQDLEATIKTLQEIKVAAQSFLQSEQPQKS